MSADPTAPEPTTERRAKSLSFTLEIWRQRNTDDAGHMVTYEATRVSPDMSFLEMLDVLNEELMRKGEEPIAFDSDCREGICGMCGLVINGVSHGPGTGTTTCQPSRSPRIRFRRPRRRRWWRGRPAA